MKNKMIKTVIIISSIISILFISIVIYKNNYMSNKDGEIGVFLIQDRILLLEKSDKTNNTNKAEVFKGVKRKIQEAREDGIISLNEAYAIMKENKDIEVKINSK